MTGKRARYSTDFKARVAREALRDDLTTAQFGAKHGILRTIVGEWKRQAMKGMVGVFSGRSAAQESGGATEAEAEKPNAKIGQLMVERGCAGLRQLC